MLDEHRPVIGKIVSEMISPELAKLVNRAAIRLMMETTSNKVVSTQDADIAAQSIIDALADLLTQSDDTNAVADSGHPEDCAHLTPDELRNSTYVLEWLSSEEYVKPHNAIRGRRDRMLNRANEEYQRLVAAGANPKTAFSRAWGTMMNEEFPGETPAGEGA
jgi:hypothetical protein|nr:MAG: hypothetical protein DIU68_21760 [Chloroflexota bacterium]